LALQSRKAQVLPGGSDHAAAMRRCTMTTKSIIALGGVLILAGAVPSFAQGVFQTPPAPNSSQSMPEPPDSAPLSARTLAPGSTGQQRVGTIATTRVQPYPAVARTVQAWR
jgi:hypothetical protein